MNVINKLAIFCGSKSGERPVYAEHAVALAGILAERQVELIYGGGKKGIMGIVADTMMEKGGIVRGVIPQVLVEWEHQHDEITELFVVEDMHVRKRKMYDLCDAAIILPGGFGTLDELFEMVTWNQLSIHNKRIFILNSDGFYDHLIAHMRFLTSEGFLWGDFDQLITILKEPAEIREHL